MLPVDLAKAEAFLDQLLEKHEDLLQEAEGFGLRLAMAYPKGLMPLREAQRIVSEFTKQKATLVEFTGHLYNSSRRAPKEFEAEIGALLAKAQKAMDKFEKDLKAAKEALLQYEDLLVGEKFQEAFEAIRLAVLDLDLADDADIDFKTDLVLDADPSYAKGWVILTLSGKVQYNLSLVYRAVDDFYGGVIEDKKSGKKYDIVSKFGHTKLPKFVRDLVDQLKALDDKNQTGLFKSRKKVQLLIEEPADIAKHVQDVLKTYSLKPPVELRPLKITGSLGMGSFKFQSHIPYYLDRSPSLPLAGFKERLSRVLKPFEINTGVSRWLVKPQLNNGTFIFYDANSPRVTHVTFNFSGNLGDLDTKAKDFFEEKLPQFFDKKMPLEAWRNLANVYRVDTSAMGRSSALIKEALRKLWSNPQMWLTLDVGITLEKVKTASSQRIVEAYLSRKAGGSSFSAFSIGSDPGRAFRDAVEDARHEYGNRGYTGSLAEKDGYEIRVQEPMSRAEANKYSMRDIENNPKWGPAFAIPVSEERVLKEEKVTVTVEARTDKDALRAGSLKIKATGRIPPKATILVEGLQVKKVGGGPRVSTYEVTGNRKQAVRGEIQGWLFYGIASS